MKVLESANAVKLAGLFFKMSSGERQQFYEIRKPLVKERTHEEGRAYVMGKFGAPPESQSC